MLVDARHQEGDLELLDHDLGEIPLADLSGRHQDLREGLAMAILRVEGVGDDLVRDEALLRQHLGEADRREFFEALHLGGIGARSSRS
jgi:hypothetical protein